MTRGVSRWLWPLELPNRVLSDRVVCARHALALDDERTTFHPVLWTEKDEKPAVPDKDGRRWIKDERLSQVWFVGMHANVGGGYPDDALAHIPLVWIAKEAERCGLAFKQDPDAFKPMRAGCDKDGRIYNSRSGLGGYYRYGPRKIVDLCLAKSSDPREDVYIEVPKIYESAFKRIASDRNAYAPIGFPGKYAVVTGDDAPGGCNEILLQNNPYENAGANRSPVHAAGTALELCLAAAGRLFPDRRGVDPSCGVLAVPLPGKPENEFTSSIRLVSEFVRFVESLLPRLVSLVGRLLCDESHGRFLIGVIVFAAVDRARLIPRREDRRCDERDMGFKRKKERHSGFGDTAGDSGIPDAPVSIAASSGS